MKNLILTTFFILAIISSHAQTLSDGLQAHWGLNGDGVDLSANHYDGMIVNATAGTNRFGEANKALHFTGDGYVNFGDILDMGLDDFSISLWYNLDVPSTSQKALLVKGIYVGSNGRYALALFKDEPFSMMDPGDNIMNFTEVPMGEDIWHHFVAIYDRDGYSKIYIDGSLVTQVDCSSAENYNMQNIGDLAVGGASNGGLGFTGFIDDVRIYNRVLTASEVTELQTITAEVEEEPEVINCSNPLNEFPYQESFEQGMGSWVQSTDDDLDWSRNTGATPTIGTGPSSASQGDYYLFADSQGSSLPIKEAKIESPCMDLSVIGGGKVTFDYNMYGSNVGNLELLISTDQGSTWTPIWEAGGSSYGEEWIRDHVYISEFTGQPVKLQFLATWNENTAGEIGLDNIKVTGSVPYQVPSLSASENYIYSKTYQTSLGTSANLKANEEVMEGVVYFDGLGRKKQAIAIKATPNQYDLVTHIGYDAYGRQTEEYLPYPDAAGNPGTIKGSAPGNTQTYYKTNYPTDFLGITAPNTNPYSEKELEASPLGRVLKQAAPGEAWKMNPSSADDHTIKYHYQTNAENEVRLYEVDLSGGYDSPLLQNPNGNFYLPGQLYKTITQDENWSVSQVEPRDHTMEEFKDKQGRVVLKRTYGASDLNLDGDTADAGEALAILDTYYVYDDYGNLTYVLPPKAGATAAMPIPNAINELCYQYVYDNRNRVIKKKIPGKGWEYIVYNQLDQPVMTQDQNQKVQNQWLFTKYDPFGRIAYTGQQNIDTTRDSLQTTVNSNPAYVSRTSSANSYAGVSVYYTNIAAPTAMNELYTINYYDDYNVDIGFSIPVFNGFSKTIASGSNTKGLPTVTKVRVLGTTQWITTALGYDDKGMVIWTKTVNPYLGTTDIVENDLDFAGTIQQTKTTHQKTGKSDILINDYFTYDHAKRLTEHTQSINGSSQEVIAENHYDETGQLTGKGVGNTTGNLRLQNVDYSYNVRGWLKGINDITSTAKLFNFALYYNDPTTGTPLYNGNISQAQWRTDNTDSSLKTYTYSYDGLNRITSAVDNTGNYNLTGVSYDVNGNILGLTRKGAINSSSSSFGSMDVLSYGYSSYSNKLLTVNDSGNDTYGFKDGSTAATQYTYDANGNLTSDANKGITGITYNFLNLPVSVTLSAGTISYIYDATGTKLRKVAAGTTTDYDGNFLYKNGNLEFLHTEEGYVEPKSTGGYEYVYYYTDHLGNVRLSYMNTGTAAVPNLQIVQENNYYPFGLQHKGCNNVINGAEYNYKTFQGQELHKDLGLNWHEWKYRFSDPAIGRFISIDPLAQEYSYQSPYNFSENRVIDGVELEGAERLSVHTPGWVYSSQSTIRNEHPTEAQMNTSTAGVIARHPIASSKVGSVESGGTNISSISGRIARHVAENGNMTVGEGSQRNALRHAVWSGAITSSQGEGIAQRIGNAHEGIPMGAQGNAHVDFDQPAPDNLGGADSVVDFLNNGIGREIGKALGEGATEWDVAVKALDVQFNEGLWTATTDKDGNISISRTKITQKQYDTALKTLSTLNRNGMNNADRKALEEETELKIMNSFKILSFMAILFFTVSCSEQKDFNSTEWKNWTESESSPNTRWLMHKDLLDNYDLKTYDKEQILDLLGKPNSETSNKYYYQLGSTGSGINTGTMIITFEKDSVIDVKVDNG